MDRLFCYFSKNKPLYDYTNIPIASTFSRMLHSTAISLAVLLLTSLSAGLYPIDMRVVRSADCCAASLCSSVCPFSSLWDFSLGVSSSSLSSGTVSRVGCCDRAASFALNYLIVIYNLLIFYHDKRKSSLKL